jgi:hypothetical protein
MLFSLAYFLDGRILGTGRRRDQRKEIGPLVLGHQMQVLQRQVERPRLHRLDRVLLRLRAGRAERPMVVVLGEAGHPAPLASGPRQEEVDI